MKGFKYNVLDIVKDLKNYIVGEKYFTILENTSPDIVTEKSDIKQNVVCDKLVKLKKLKDSLKYCKLCSLKRNNLSIVFESGNPKSKIMIIGGVPSKEDDIHGAAFSGHFGTILNNMLKAIGLSRKNTYLCNVLKCAPSSIKQPVSNEISRCKDYLFKQISIIKPKIILCLGEIASQVVLNSSENINKLRGNVYKPEHLNSISVIPTFHPSDFENNLPLKKLNWQDLQKFRDLCNELNLRE